MSFFFWPTDFSQSTGLELSTLQTQYTEKVFELMEHTKKPNSTASQFLEASIKTLNYPIDG